MAERNVKAASTSEDNGDHDNAHHWISLWISRKGKKILSSSSKFHPESLKNKLGNSSNPDIQAPSLKCCLFLENSSFRTGSCWCAHAANRNWHPVMIKSRCSMSILTVKEKVWSVQAETEFFHCDEILIGSNMQRHLHLFRQFHHLFKPYLETLLTKRLANILKIYRLVVTEE